MSECDIDHVDLPRAAAYNAGAGYRIGWRGQIPDEAGLANDAYDTESFALAVARLQAELDVGVDGMLGRETWDAILRRYDRVTTADRYVVHRGRRRKMPARSWRLLAYDHPQGIDIHADGHFGRRAAGISHIVVHWGSTSARRLAKVLDSRGVSTHFAVERNGDGRASVYQYLDTRHRAWHAGNINDRSIGIDICQQPTRKWVDRLKAKGIDVEEADNPYDVGDRRICTLDPVLAEATRELVADLCEVYGIPTTSPPPLEHVGLDAIVEHGWGVVGHHHVTATKWDIAPWWHQVWP